MEDVGSEDGGAEEVTLETGPVWEAVGLDTCITLDVGLLPSVVAVDGGMEGIVMEYLDVV